MRELHRSRASVLQRMRAHDAGAFEKDPRSRATLLFTRLREPRERTPKETRTRATTTVMRMRLRAPYRKAGEAVPERAQPFSAAAAPPGSSEPSLDRRSATATSFPGTPRVASKSLRTR